MSDTFDENDFISEDNEEEKGICITKDGQRIKLSEIEDNHLTNRIKYFKRMLARRPSEMVYVGDSVYAEDCVDMENTHNEALAEDIKEHIQKMEEEKEKRIKEVKENENEN